MSTEDFNQEEQTQGQKPPRDSQGRFIPGHSGNPAGRPKGSANRLLQQVRDWSESRGVEILIEAAEAGNLDVAKTLVSMAMPKRRPATMLLEGLQDLPTPTPETIGEFETALFAKVCAGAVSHEDAAALIDLANNIVTRQTSRKASRSQWDQL